MLKQPVLNPHDPSNTPLKMAARSCSLDLVKTLVSYGAEPYPGMQQKPHSFYEKTDTKLNKQKQTNNKDKTKRITKQRTQKTKKLVF